jgi:hypothetical protein
MNFLESIEYFYNVCKCFFEQLYSNDFIMIDDEENDDIEPLS